jgi:two-component system, OmpR family, sensor histidine kinase MtrB
VPGALLRGLARLRPRRLGLRARITTTFALGALVLSGVLATTTYLATRGSLLRQRESAAVRQAYFDARVIAESLKVPEAFRQYDEIFSQVQSRDTKAIIFVTSGSDVTAWSDVSFPYAKLPRALVNRVRGFFGNPAQMRYRVDGQMQLAIGIPLPDQKAEYYEVVPLTELSNTLSSIRLALLGAAALTTVLGALLGLWASRRAVRPLVEAARAAEAIAGGRLGTRLEPVDDRDLLVLTTAFNDMASALERRLERDARFASDVSHELRSPLTTLSATVEVLQSRRDELPERSVAALDLLAGEVARFSGMVEDLLEISRFDAGAVRLDLERVMVVELVHQAVAAAGYDGLVPVTVANDDLRAIAIRGDKRRLARAIANLLDNARNYAGGATEISVERSLDGDDTVLIAVEDAGPGVTSSDRHLIFERFNRGTVAGRRGMGDGTGLGLALVEGHVNLHRGQIWVEDRRDGKPGARFVIELPVAAP